MLLITLPIYFYLQLHDIFFEMADGVGVVGHLFLQQHFLLLQVLMDYLDIVFCELARVNFVYILEVLIVLKEMLFPESHILLIGIQGQQCLLSGHIEWIQVNVLVFFCFAPEADSAFFDPTFHHLEVAITQEITI